MEGWTPWTEERWQTWLETSAELLKSLEKLDKENKVEERNELIDKKASHWGELKPWLQALSKGKCWFSEVRDLYSHWDVEHFRPKKLAKSLDGTKRDGYWWLAFDYTNYRICGNVGNRKKGGWFPLKEGSLRSTYADRCEESESQYLIDPVDVYDVGLIAFNEEGDVVPAPGILEWEKCRVEVSIKRMKLNEHAPLTEARREVWQEMSKEIESYYRAKSRLGKSINPAAKENAKNHLLKIKAMTRKEAELSAVAKWCINFRNDPQLLQLVA
ncbi:MAG: hypothetical protein GY866_39570 [Proteobacteria bacterium]|nr:hypothetical protein [Pseudomonadota bacterium]